MTNYVSGDSYENGGPWASEILGDRLGNYCTAETEEFEADQYERQSGRLVRRSWETDDEWEARKAAHERVDQPPQSVIDPAMAIAEIKRLERSYGRPMPENLTAEQRDQWAARWEQINGLRSAAGLQKVDYARVRPQQTTEAVLEKFAEFQTYGEEDRVGICGKAKDRNFLRLVTTRDASEKVREAAEKRLSMLSVKVG